jgi:hypothetical protein
MIVLLNFIRYELKTVDIGGNFWEYNAEKTFYQMLLGGVDYLLLGQFTGIISRDSVLR